MLLLDDDNDDDHGHLTSGIGDQFPQGKPFLDNVDRAGIQHDDEDDILGDLSKPVTTSKVFLFL